VHVPNTRGQRGPPRFKDRASNRPGVLQTCEKFCQGLVGRLGRFLLYPVTDARQDRGAAKVTAVNASFGVGVHPGDKGAHLVVFAADKARGLGHGFTGNLRQLRHVQCLSTVAVERSAKASLTERAHKDLQILRREPCGKRLGVGESDQQALILGLGFEEFANTGVQRPLTREGEVHLAQGRRHIGFEVCLGPAFFLKVELIEKSIAIDFGSDF